VCTLALSRYLGLATSPLLAREVDRVVAEGAYETTVFFIRNQGFVRATAARRISFEDSLVFEQLHEQAYRDLGFQLVEVPAGPLPDRVALVRQTVDRLATGQVADDRVRVRSLSHKNSRTSGRTSPPIP
jgi:predicted ATPase